MVLLARQVNVANVVVFINKCDLERRLATQRQSGVAYRRIFRATRGSEWRVFPLTPVTRFS
ncbi:MAG: hypothetical protein KY475_27300 [Planctomycetes bacterium]|nr:hypothetical protein [Planctomycetota bacterium]